MLESKHVLSIIAIVTAGFLYERYKSRRCLVEGRRDLELVRKYLLNGHAPNGSCMPIIWIHTTREINARWWSDFCSRNSTCVNQPYEMITIKSAIDRCANSFYVCLIDDDTFEKLMPDWCVSLDRVAEPEKTKLRELAFARLLVKYGGLRLPPSFLCSRDMIDIYRSGTDGGRIMVGCMPDRSITSSRTTYGPSPAFLGCLPGSETMALYADFLQGLADTDHTAASVFQGDIGSWLSSRSDDEVVVLSPESLGVADADGKEVCIERLAGSSPLELAAGAYGLYVPANDILSRTAYQWLARLSPEQMLSSNTALGKHLLVGSQEPAQTV